MECFARVDPNVMYSITTLVTRCIDAFFAAKSDTKIDLWEEFIVLSDLSKDKQYENDNKKGKEYVVCVDSGTQRLMQFSKDSKILHLISFNEWNDRPN